MKSIDILIKQALEIRMAGNLFGELETLDPWGSIVFEKNTEKRIQILKGLAVDNQNYGRLRQLLSVLPLVDDDYLYRELTADIKTFERSWGFLDYMMAYGHTNIFPYVESFLKENRADDAILHSAGVWLNSYADIDGEFFPDYLKIPKKDVPLKMRPMFKARKRTAWISPKFNSNFLSSQEIFEEVIFNGRSCNSEIYLVSLGDHNSQSQEKYSSRAHKFIVLKQPTAELLNKILSENEIDFAVDLGVPPLLWSRLNCCFKLGVINNFSVVPNYYNAVISEADSLPTFARQTSILVDSGANTRILLPRYERTQYSKIQKKLKKDSAGIIFGCFCRNVKISDRCLSTFAAILRELPSSKLFFSSIQLDNYSFVVLADKLIANGVRRDQIGFFPRTDPSAHQKKYLYVDVVLESFPQGGGFSLGEALFLGVPVVCLESKYKFKDFGSSLLRMIGLNEFVCQDTSEYIKKAIQLGKQHSLSQTHDLSLKEKLLAAPCFTDRSRLSEGIYNAIDELATG